MKAKLAEPLTENRRNPRTQGSSMTRQARRMLAQQPVQESWAAPTQYFSSDKCWQTVVEYAQHWYGEELRRIHCLSDAAFISLLGQVATEIASRPYVSIEELGDILANKPDFYDRFARYVLMQPKSIL